MSVAGEPTTSSQAEPSTREPTGLLAWEHERFERVTAALDLDESTMCALHCAGQSLIVEFPLLRDDGSMTVLTGYRVQHSNALGPAKGRDPIADIAPLAMIGYAGYSSSAGYEGACVSVTGASAPRAPLGSVHPACRPRCCRSAGLWPQQSSSRLLECTPWPFGAVQLRLSSRSSPCSASRRCAPRVRSGSPTSATGSLASTSRQSSPRQPQESPSSRSSHRSVAIPRRVGPERRPRLRLSQHDSPRVESTTGRMSLDNDNRGVR